MIRHEGGYCQMCASAQVKDLGLCVGGVLIDTWALVSLGFQSPSAFLPL